MRVSVIFAVGLSAAVSVAASAVRAGAPTLAIRAAYPACADPCLGGNLFGCDSDNDFACLCANHQFLDSTSQCIYNHCNSTDLEQAQQTAEAICKAAGVPITSTYTPTQSRTTTATASLNGSVSTGAPVTTTSYSTTATPTIANKKSAAFRTTSGAATFLGTVVLGALAFSLSV